MRRLVLLFLLLATLAGCGGGSLEAPSGAVMTLTPTSKEGAFIEITSSSTVQKSIVQLYQLSVKDSSLTGAKGVRDTIFDVTFELTNVPGTTTADLASLVTLCDGSAIINTTTEKQTDGQGIYNLCVVFKVGGGLNYTGNLRALSGGASASTSIKVTSTLPVLAVSPTSMTVPAGSYGQFTVTGGSPEYTVTSSNSSAPPLPPTVTTNGGTFLVSIPASTPKGTTVIYTIRDSANGAPVAATVTVDDPSPLTVFPSTATVTANSTTTFTVFGGLPPYQVFSSTPSISPDRDSVASNGGIFKVSIPAFTPVVTATMTVRDSRGVTTSAAITVQAPTKPVITPAALTMNAGSTATFAISGGVPGYTIVSSNINATPSPSQVADSGDTFHVLTSSTMPTTSGITITALDAIGQIVSATLSITALPLQLTITPTARTIDPSTQQTITFTITGGTGPYNTNLLNKGDAYIGSPGNDTTTGSSFAVTVPAWAAAGTVTVRVVDAASSTRTATITVPSTPRIELSSTATISSTTGGTIGFTLSHGKGPYAVTSSNAAQMFLGSSGNASLSVASPPSTFTGTVPVGAPTGTVTITVTGVDGAANTVGIVIGP